MKNEDVCFWEPSSCSLKLQFLSWQVYTSNSIYMKKKREKQESKNQEVEKWFIVNGRRNIIVTADIMNYLLLILIFGISGMSSENGFGFVDHSTDYSLLDEHRQTCESNDCDENNDNAVFNCTECIDVTFEIP